MARHLDYMNRHTVDFDDYQPCFYEGVDREENFYGTPVPSEDIWKKFELIPTPPRSPRREECSSLCPNPSDKLSLVSGMLDYDDPMSQTLVFPLSDIISPCCNLKSNLIQDCMWSGFQGEDAKTESTDNTRTAKTSTLNTSEENTAACVDPATVFPYPVNDSSANRDHSYSASCSVMAETPSDSEDEIDVVTVDKMQFPRKKLLTSATPVKPAELREQLTAVVAGMKCTKRPARSVSIPGSPASKKIRYNVQDSDLKSLPLQKLSKSISSSRSSSQASSDSEECDVGKRSQHNVLERKRRNDLKFSFFTLRDHVPELESQERAAKVVILKKATDYIMQLNKSHQKFTKQLNSEHERKERLLAKLAELRSLEDFF